MQENNKTELGRTLLVETNREEIGVNIFLGFITSLLGITIIGVFLDGNWLFERIFKHISALAFGLQIFPILFSLIARKIESLQRLWLATFWLTLLLELILTTVLMVFILPN